VIGERSDGTTASAQGGASSGRLRRRAPASRRGSAAVRRRTPFRLSGRIRLQGGVIVQRSKSLADIDTGLFYTRSGRPQTGRRLGASRQILASRHRSCYVRTSGKQRRGQMPGLVVLPRRRLRPVARRLSPAARQSGRHGAAGKSVSRQGEASGLEMALQSIEKIDSAPGNGDYPFRIGRTTAMMTAVTGRRGRACDEHAPQRGRPQNSGAAPD